MGFWSGPTEYVEWPIPRLAASGYSVELTYSCGVAPGGNFVLTVGKESLKKNVASTGNWGNFKTIDLGRIGDPGEARYLTVKPIDQRGVRINLASIRLVPLGGARPVAAVVKRSNLPVPSATVQAKAKAAIRELFKEDYGRKTRYQRFQLAKKLFELGRKANEQQDRRYVLFRESMDVAAGVGEIKGALLALRELDLLFDVDKDALRWDVLTAATRKATSDSQLRAIANAYFLVAEESRDRDDFSSAQRAAGAASSAARKASDRTLVTRSSDFIREINAIRKELPTVRRALDGLKRNSDDPKLNLVVGRHECITRGRWDRGLRYLARGAHEGMKAAAVKDLARPAGFNGRVEVGDAWWDVSEKMTGKTKQGLLGRAAGWYTWALPEAPGDLSEARIRKRLAQVPETGIVIPSASVPPPPAGNP